jgi:hypothetical protein
LRNHRAEVAPYSLLMHGSCRELLHLRQKSHPQFRCSVFFEIGTGGT